MDTRKRLEVGHKLLLKGIDCTIDSVVGAGSNAIVYSAWYYDELNTSLKHYVLIKELFPYHPKGEIYRDENNCIVVSETAREYYALHKQSFEYGNGIHLTLLQKYPEKTGANINTYSLNNTQYTVLGFSGGRSLEEEIKSGNKKSLKETAIVMLGILDSLKSFHNQSLLHMDISWDNVLVIGKGEYERYMLIDYNSVHNIGLKTDHSHEYFSAKPGFSAHEVRNGQIDKIGKASDLYSVGAVFYALLTGSVLTQMQMLRRNPPDVSDTKFLLDMPETVKDMVRKILCKSLATLCEKRYQSAEEMEQDFKELIDRIDGVGITHWALWEAGRKNILNAVKTNTALEYISDKDMLYPIDVLDKDKNRIRIEDAIKNVSENKNRSIVLKGAGGSGKTTALLKCIYYQSGKYSSLTPAFTYVSLYGADEADTHFVKNKILENLHFKADTSTFEMARHKLLNLLKAPLKSPSGDKPKLVIMLDGFNEASGNKEKLIKEIKELSELEGVSIIMSTRSFSGELSFDEVEVLPLKDEEVLEVLSKDGLIIEDNGEIRELLKTPLMLSIYTETAKYKGGQINVTTKDELIGTYLENLCEKEIRNKPDGDSEKWLIDASVKLLLPAIAFKTYSKHCSVNDKELLPVTKKCCKIISSKVMSRAFPMWIGHTGDIKSRSVTVDEWHGKAVREVLFERLGLLTRDQDGKYRICHQIIEEFLVLRNRENFVRLRVPKLIIGAAYTLGIASVMAGLLLTINYVFPDSVSEFFARFDAMDVADAERVLGHAVVGYQQSGSMYEALLELTENYNHSMWDYCYEHCESLFDRALSDNMRSSCERSVRDMEKVLGENSVMPYSYRKFDMDTAVWLINRQSQMAEVYKGYIPYLQGAKGYNSDEYMTLFKEVLDADATLSAAIYHYCCNIHLSKMDAKSTQYKSFVESVSTLSEQEKHREPFFPMETLDLQYISNLEKEVKYKHDEMSRLVNKYKIICRER